jgi:hypothetical protein
MSEKVIFQESDESEDVSMSALDIIDTQLQVIATCMEMDSFLYDTLDEDKIRTVSLWFRSLTLCRIKYLRNCRVII